MHAHLCLAGKHSLILLGQLVKSLTTQREYQKYEGILLSSFLLPWFFLFIQFKACEHYCQDYSISKFLIAFQNLNGYDGTNLVRFWEPHMQLKEYLIKYGITQRWCSAQLGISPRFFNFIVQGKRAL